MNNQQEPNLTYTSAAPSNESGSNSPNFLKRLDKSGRFTDPDLPTTLTPMLSSANTHTPVSEHAKNKLVDSESSDDVTHKDVELDEFIVTLLSKPSERMFLLKLEQDLTHFIRNYQMYRLDLPQMNSYQRLMVHKVAPYFHLSHFFDPLRQSIFLCKNPHTKVPTTGFMDLVRSPEDINSQQGAFKIMKRAPLSSQHQYRKHHSHNSNNNQELSIEERKKAMTFEERKMAYEEARARIFSDLEESQPQP
ncbi:single-stranded nucleic acid binding R3H [Chlamydoabsidia padenii]|nr:single-stranded nucleic acid binding R3H [Chlamydoabsidia padenii]